MCGGPSHLQQNQLEVQKECCFLGLSVQIQKFWVRARESTFHTPGSFHLKSLTFFFFFKITFEGWIWSTLLKMQMEKQVEGGSKPGG